MEEKKPDIANELINYAAIRGGSGDSWEQFWNESIPTPQNVESLLRQCVAYPDPIFYKLATIYCCIPSALSRICPVLVCYGKKGSGKSTTGFVATKLYNTPVLTAADTFASVRNTLDAQKYLRTGKDTSFERNTIMVWDDLDPSVFFERPNLYRMLKSGYNRNSDRISIASSKAGENITMRVFAPRILSSISPLHNFPELDELSRRCLVIATKPIEDFTPSEIVSLNLPPGESFDPIDLASISWKGLEGQLFRFWNDEGRATEFIAIRKALGRKNNKYRKLSTFDSNKWTISVDLLATAIASNYLSPDDAIEFFNQYWQWHEDHCKQSNSAFNSLLREFLDDELKQIKQANVTLQNAGQSPIPEIVPASVLKKQISAWSVNGQLDKRPTIDTIVAEMRSIGFSLTTQGWVKTI